MTLKFTKSDYKVVSGGQTGVDQAGLQAAKDCGIATGGWAPKNWETLDGPQRALLKSFGLKEHDGGYRQRTIQNIKDSDITVCISRKWGSPGTVLTINSCVRHMKPFIALTEDFVLKNSAGVSPRFKDNFASKTTKNSKIKLLGEVLANFHVINVAGNAEQNASGIYDNSYNMLTEVFRSMVSDM